MQGCFLVRRQSRMWISHRLRKSVRPIDYSWLVLGVEKKDPFAQRNFKNHETNFVIGSKLVCKVSWEFISGAKCDERRFLVGSGNAIFHC